MGVFRPLLIQPSPIEAEVVVEAPGGPIERVAQKRRVCGRQRAHTLRRFTEIFQQHRKNKRACIVVGAVAFGEVGDTEKGMLENTRGIRHSQQMVQPDLGRSAALPG